MKKTITSIILLLFVHQIVSQTTQNLCRDAASAGFTFAADPSDCHRYLWCHPNGTTFTLDCRNNNPDFPFFKDDFCTSTNTHCNPASLLCPVPPAPDVMIAIPGDCTHFRPCRLPGITPFPCPDAHRFDRSTGNCVSEETVHCIYDDMSGFVCPGNGFFRYGQSCTQFVFCWDGEIVHRNECREGYYYSEVLESCCSNLDADCTCPYAPPIDIK